MLGRIMAGSQLIAAHDDEGQVVYFEYSPLTCACLRSSRVTVSDWLRRRP
jgi:hypothetical protein